MSLSVLQYRTRPSGRTRRAPTRNGYAPVTNRRLAVRKSDHADTHRARAHADQLSGQVALHDEGASRIGLWYPEFLRIDPLHNRFTPIYFSVFVRFLRPEGVVRSRQI